MRVLPVRGVEMVTRAITSAGIVALLATGAMAEQLPSWKIEDICREDSAPGQCSLFERRARNAVSGSWGVLPTAVQAACLESTRAPADQSWRELAGCIEIETLHAKAERAIATARTPADPEPPAQPASEPAAEPAAAAVPPASEAPAAGTPPAAAPEPARVQ